MLLLPSVLKRSNRATRPSLKIPALRPMGAEKLEVGGNLRDWANVGGLLVITASNEDYKYLVVLVRNSDTGWKIARLIWNRNR